MLLKHSNSSWGYENTHGEQTLGAVHNYYEKLVIETVLADPATAGLPDDLKADLVCLALNRLPPKYVRFDVDTAFYLSAQDRLQLKCRVDDALAAAREYLHSREAARPSAQPA